MKSKVKGAYKVEKIPRSLYEVGASNLKFAELDGWEDTVVPENDRNDFNGILGDWEEFFGRLGYNVEMFPRVQGKSGVLHNFFLKIEKQKSRTRNILVEYVDYLNLREAMATWSKFYDVLGKGWIFSKEIEEDAAKFCNASKIPVFVGDEVKIMKNIRDNLYLLENLD